MLSRLIHDHWVPLFNPCSGTCPNGTPPLGAVVDIRTVPEPHPYGGAAMDGLDCSPRDQHRYCSGKHVSPDHGQHLVSSVLW